MEEGPLEQSLFLKQLDANSAESLRRAAEFINTIVLRALCRNLIRFPGFGLIGNAWILELPTCKRRRSELQHSFHPHLKCAAENGRANSNWSQFNFNWHFLGKHSADPKGY